MGILQTLFPRQTFQNFLNLSVTNINPTTKWHEDSKRSNPNRRLRRRQKSSQKLVDQIRKRQHKLLSPGSVLCVSLKCQIQKRTNNTLKANILKLLCPKN